MKAWTYKKRLPMPQENIGTDAGTDVLHCKMLLTEIRKQSGA